MLSPIVSFFPFAGLVSSPKTVWAFVAQKTAPKYAIKLLDRNLQQYTLFASIAVYVIKWASQAQEAKQQKGEIRVIFKTLITTTELAKSIDAPDWAVIDCRFSLNDPERGRRDFQAGHIPGARYAHLDQDLSAAMMLGKTGRHPLPTPDRCAEIFSKWGIDERVQVVVYDDMSGAIAARLWWMLRWLGHDAVAVLDGGWPVWLEEKRPISHEATTRTPHKFRARVRTGAVVDANLVLEKRLEADYLILDARGLDRYRGENETIDPVAGHIPGALSAPFSNNLNQQGVFHTPKRLRQRYLSLLGEIPCERVIVYCGSGVTAAHDILAMAHAGLGEAKLYAGSWSDWITDNRRPVATGSSVFGKDPKKSPPGLSPSTPEESP